MLLLILVKFLILLPPCIGEECKQASAVEKVDHFEPVHPFDEDGYRRPVLRSFFYDCSPEVWMVALPSRGVEYSILLLADPNPTIERDRQQGLWRVVTRASKRQIWRYKNGDEGFLELDIREAADITQSAVSVPTDFAEELRKTWEEVLLQTRYSGLHSPILGDTTYIVGTPLYGGEIYESSLRESPSGRPALLIDLAHLLRELAECDTGQFAAKLHECLELAKLIRHSK